MTHHDDSAKPEKPESAAVRALREHKHHHRQPVADCDWCPEVPAPIDTPAGDGPIYTVPARVSTVAELDALPVGTVVLDREGDPWMGMRKDRWASPEIRGEATSDRVVRGFGPLALLHVPGRVLPAPDLPSGEAFWNGLPTTALRGTAVVADAPEFPLYWARDLVGQRIPVVRVDLDGVNYGGGITHLDDRDGSGWAKVTEGRGGPRWPHRNVAIVADSFEVSR